MNWLHALILGIVEGLTEFVPVSSTGHLILVTRALRLSGPGADSFDIVIQLGALLAAVIYYRKLLWQMGSGLMRAEPRAQQLALALVVATAPALGLGYLLSKRIKALLFGPLPVAGALIVGGLIMMAVDRWKRSAPDRLDDLSAISWQQALLVGLTQSLALWPGTSRSMATIVGGQLAGLSTAAAADFAFLLAIPTLGAATCYELLKSRHTLLHEVGPLEIAIGMGVSFVVGWLVIAAFLRYLRRFGLLPFGAYRIALGVLVFALVV